MTDTPKTPPFLTDFAELERRVVAREGLPAPQAKRTPEEKTRQYAEAYGVMTGRRSYRGGDALPVEEREEREKK